MKARSTELWLALETILLITLVYVGVTLYSGVIPAASQLIGHSLGIIGILLMVFTEVGYSLRKRTRSIRWGKMSTWLKMHIYAGLVGPYLALLHTSWKFNGLAGVLMLLTAIIVISGFIGRYIYTAVPRTVEGAEIQASEISRQEAVVEGELAVYLQGQSETARATAQRLIAQSHLPASNLELVFGRAWLDSSLKRQWTRHKQQMDHFTRAQAQKLEDLLDRRYVLRRQAASLEISRRFLATWHTIHIPIGMALFTVALFHMVGAVYLATLLH